MKTGRLIKADVIFDRMAANILLIWTIALYFSLSLTSSARESDHFKAADLHVALHGNDLNSGTQDKPFATLEKARDRIRTIIRDGKLPKGGITVWIHCGTYMRNKTFEIGSEDGGHEKYPVTYRAVPGEEVRITGGIPIDRGMFKSVSDPAILARLSPESRGNVLELDLPALGVRHRGPFPEIFGHVGQNGNGGIVDLYFNGRRLNIARWPNNGYTTIKEVIDSGDTREKRPGTFIYNSERPAKWLKAVNSGGLWIAGFWRVPWVIQTVKVKSIDPANRTITQAVPLQGGLGSKYSANSNGTRKGDGKEAWYVLNIPEELDLPGEWVMDFTAGKLYLWPPSELKPGSLLISDLDNPLLSIKAAEYVCFRDLIFEGGLVSTIYVEGGRHNLIAGCTVRNTGETGIVIKDGKHNGTRDCDLYNLGAGGISISGGDRKTLSPAGNFAVNNHIHHYGEVTKIVNGVEISGVGNLLAHNLIHDGTYGGVQYRGNNHVMEYNEIHNIGLDGGDLGGFYSTSDWASAGNVVRHNFVHHSRGCQAFYMDDGHSSDEICSNIVYECFCGPFIGGGHNHKVRNNVIINSKKGIHIDDRGISRKYNKNSAAHYRSFKEFAENNPLFTKSYPGINEIPEVKPEYPTGHLLIDNVMVNCEKNIDYHGGKKSFDSITAKDNLVMKTDPGFTNPGNLDFSLKAGADPQVATKLSWLTDNFARIGLYKDEFRRKLPSPDEAARNSHRPPRQIFDSTTDLKASNMIENRKMARPE